MYVEKKPGEQWEIWFGLNNTFQMTQEDDRVILNDDGVLIMHSDKQETRVFIPAQGINRILTRHAGAFEEEMRYSARHENIGIDPNRDPYVIIDSTPLEIEGDHG